MLAFCCPLRLFVHFFFFHPLNLLPVQREQPGNKAALIFRFGAAGVPGARSVSARKDSEVAMTVNR